MYPGHWGITKPDHPAVIMAGTRETITYGELDRRSRCLAGFLWSRGLRRGDHVAILMHNDVRYFEMLWAALRSGMYVTPVNWHLKPDEVAYVIGDCEAKLLFTSARQSDLVEDIDWRTLPALTTRVMADGTTTGFEPYESVVAFEGEPAEESSGAAMLYTSGTTGRPKGVLRPLPDTKPGDLDAASHRLAALFGIDEQSTYLSPAPQYHAAPLTFTLAAHRAGATVVMMEKFDARDALKAIDMHGVTHSQWVPTMFVRMLALSPEDKQAADLSTHSVALHAGAPCPPEIKRQMIDWWGPILVEYYGGSDGGGFTVIDSLDWLAHPGSVGRSRTGAVYIVDEDADAVVGPGQTGTVYFSGDPGFVYKGDPEKTERSRRAGGELSTMGDIGYLDADGYLYLTDRKEFTIISGGVNIYPREAEDVLILHSDVQDVAVFGIPHHEFGEEVKAAVQLKPGVTATPELAGQLIAFTRARLASFKCPRSVDFLEQLPRTPTGKLRKADLRSAYAQGNSTP
ncbi:acyl-CoA synthetase [Mycobacterium sp. UM_CSW]|uniref:acyl-CoA synthetase n=1 Tax=Mycobacterium sp. UM_CSW TaxID=1370119 RepID=UPI00040CC84C|nr:acyl-CoA synthetase [Mycobacterium sp. UM_CSW]